MLVFVAGPYTYAHTRLHAVPVANMSCDVGLLSECIALLCVSSEDLHCTLCAVGIPQQCPIALVSSITLLVCLDVG